MPYALCPIVPHVTEKGYSISRGTKKEKGDTLISFFFLIAGFF